MGIPGLWPVLEPCCQPVTLESLEGKKLAVDVSLWMCQANAITSETRDPFLTLMISRLCKLLFYKIRPVFVFDGKGVPVFKQRILQERRMKKHEEEVVLNKNNIKLLEGIAKNNQGEEEVVKHPSPKKKLAQEEEIFMLPSTSAPVIEITDDDADLAVMKVVEAGVMSRTSEIERLVELREQIRLSRLHPDSIPEKTEDFCQFQLARVLGRNKIDRTIKKLTVEHQNKIAGANIRLALSDARGGSHIISYDGCDEVTEIFPESAKEEANWESLRLTLDHFQTSTSQDLLNDSKKEEDDDSFDISEIAELNGREEFLGKSSMIEKFMMRRIGSNRAEALQQDAWSSDSEDDDFIDVSDGEMKVSEISLQKEDQTFEKEWSPGKDLTASEENEAIQKRDEFLIKTKDNEAGIYTEVQEFLRACGFPWIQAPGEAEAQCVELERLGLVEGIISDDSDVWAFGAHRVYRNLFAQGKNVQFYNKEHIFNQTSLSQPNFVEIAMLSGGDYSPGIERVGVVTAIELLTEFSPNRLVGEEMKEVNTTMSRIEEWIFSKNTTEISPIRRKIKAIINKYNIIEHLHQISNPDIVVAYLRPNVDTSKEPLRWRSVDIEKLRDIIQTKLGWNYDRFDKVVLPSFQKWNDYITGKASYQKHITSYTLVQSSQEQKIEMTKRVAEALARLSKKMNPEPPSLICQATFEDNETVMTRKPIKRKEPSNKGRGGKNVPKRAPLPRLVLSESSDSDF